MTYKEQLKKTGKYEFELPKTGKMLVPGKIFASEELMKHIEDDAINQVANVACLPGIYKYSLAMPDLHTGYGFGIGGVAAIDYENGGISPGGIGYDINCGVRLLKTNLKKEQIYPKIKELLDSLFRHVPAGLGGSNIRISKEEINKVLEKGVNWAIENGYGTEEDKEFCEENGCMKEASAMVVSDHAKSRGHEQLGTLGSGNHFLEVQYVDEIFNKDVAEVFGIKETGQVMIMIHCGSRGLGHQVCSDYLREMEKTFPEIVAKLPDHELIYAPSSSPLCKKYFSAMVAAANFAWCNRHIIGHQTRLAFSKIFPDVEIKTIYDVAHNICKVENHKVNGEIKKVYMHRKGATRAFGPGSMDIPSEYREVGQPIIIPGSMGTASYLLVGTKKAEEISFASTAHGAGREMSRHQALKQWRGETLKKDLEAKNIFVKSASWKGLAEEAPGAYKDIEEVVNVSHEVGIGIKVARLRPIGVIKG